MPVSPPISSILGRRLGAAMFTDIAGYCAHVQRSESEAVELLEEHRRILRQQFGRFNGREVKTTGDGFLVEFESALEAVQCGVEIQRVLGERNSGIESQRRIEVRIGIHIGDLVIDGDDIIGDCVNLASRLEGMSEPGGMCVSGDVARQVHNKIEVPLQRVGVSDLKGFEYPIEVFRSRAQGTGARAERPRAIHCGFLHSRLSRLIAIGFTVCLALVPVFLLGGPARQLPCGLNSDGICGRAWERIFNRDPDSVDDAQEMLVRQSRKDERCARTFALIAICRLLKADYIAGRIEWQRLTAETYSFAEQALKVDPNSAPAHTALGGYYLFLKGDWPLAQYELERALSITDYSNILAYLWLAELAMHRSGSLAEAERYLSAAEELEPKWKSVLLAKGHYLYYRGDYRQSIAELKSVSSPAASQWLGKALTLAGRYDEALKVFESPEVSNLRGTDANRAFCYALSGEYGKMKARSIFEHASGLSEFDRAKICAGLGDGKAAIAHLKEARKSLWDKGDLAFLEVDPMFGLLRDDAAVSAEFYELCEAIKRDAGIVAHLAFGKPLN